MADVAICPECEAPTDEPGTGLTGYLYHPECCDHENVTSEDNGSGDGVEAPRHQWAHVCDDCGADLMATPDGWERV